MKRKRKVPKVLLVGLLLIAGSAIAEWATSTAVSEPATVVFSAGLSGSSAPGGLVARYRTSCPSEAVQIDTSPRTALLLILR